MLTGIPSGIIPNFTNFTGAVQADMLRLNTSIPPASSPNILGLLGGDLAGFPNARRVFDDVVSVELRAVAGATYPLIESSFTPDGAAVYPNVAEGDYTIWHHDDTPALHVRVTGGHVTTARWPDRPSI